MSGGIAIVGMACRFAGACSPDELWENVLAQRCAFRRLPPERLSLDDYFAADPATADATYAGEAALLEDYEFDRVRFRVAGPTFRSADMAHWLALDVAEQALRDAGFPEGRALPRAATCVLVGNTLTGEFSRASGLRLRWPYVRRMVDAQLAAEGWDAPRRGPFLRRLESAFKQPFEPVGEESLAGGLSNTIAGRICNQFHFGGGGYTVDGACSSSLLAVVHACEALESGRAEAALAGGVDLSLDPFELVGFAKTGALARGEMRVYDRRSSGFLPGEGCGFVLLMRLDAAASRGLEPYAVIRGWGVSSDGGGGITRPEVAGQRLALERAYRHAGYGPERVAYFEGHGTGTPVGDEVELQALAEVLREAAAPKPAALGSIKPLIGHTKAAAGIAGLIKTALVVQRRLLPPTAGALEPRAPLGTPEAPLRVLRAGEPCPDDRPLRAGVSSFGFGGINVHVTLETGGDVRAGGLASRERRLLASAQDAEVFFFSASDAAALGQQVRALGELAGGLSRAELTDVAAALAARCRGGRARAALVASSAAQLADGLRELAGWLEAAPESRLELDHGACLGFGARPARLGFLFPGQASPVRVSPDAWGRRFARVQDIYAHAALDAIPEGLLPQPAVITAARAGLSVLRALCVEADVALGHSLGELAALHWADALSADELDDVVRCRARLMSEAPGEGVMVGIAARAEVVAGLLPAGAEATVACLNAPDQTVVSGTRRAVDHVLEAARARGLSATPLATTHGFHSPLMLPAREGLAERLRACRLRPPRRRVFSTVLGAALPADADLVRLLADQLTHPVRFTEALAGVRPEPDLWLEVGPGQVLTQLTRDGRSSVPAVALDVGGPSLRGLLVALAAAHALGAPVDVAGLFEDRFARPIELHRARRFLANPCESAPRAPRETAAPAAEAPPAPRESRPAPGAAAREQAPDALELVRELVARRAELPASAVHDDSRLLRDLHLNSISVGVLVAEAAQRLHVHAPAAPLELSDATLAEVAAALERLRVASDGARPAEHVPAGVDRWVRAFRPALRERRARSAPARPRPAGRWSVHGDAPPALLTALRARGASWPGDGVLVCLGAGDAQTQAERLLDAAHELVARDGGERSFAVLQCEDFAGAFARTLHAEHPQILTCVVQAPLDERAVGWLEDELTPARSGHTEAVYDEHGRRHEALLVPLPADGLESPCLAPGELLVASGGGKGIVAECALALAQDTGARLALLGRSNPEADGELAAGLERLTRAGVAHRYLQVDVTDAEAVQAALVRVQAEWGPVAGVLHGAGLNAPRLLSALDRAALRATLAPKLSGLRNVLAALDPRHLRLLVTFGSVIGRFGMRGEADYALANAALTRMCARFQQRHPDCRCLALESSVWADVGMGERLGRVDALARNGITAIDPREGAALVRRLARRPTPGTVAVIAGRLGASPPVALEGPALPLRRFSEQARVHYPGVELVVDAELSTATDLYLRDHVFDGRALMPGVALLEAMAQAAMAVVGATSPPTFEQVRFERATAFEGDAPVTLRVAALVREAGEVDVVVRCSSTGFQADHARARCRFGSAPAPAPAEPIPETAEVALQPERDLYGSVFFQTGRFRRVEAYLRLSAGHACARIAAGRDEPWFGAFLPQQLDLGDLSARDAALHSIQACVPHVVLLPVGVERIVPGVLPPGVPLVALARERWSRGDDYCYDLEIRGPGAAVLERWEGLRLRRVGERDARAWPDALLAALLEWKLRELVPLARIQVALQRGRNGAQASATDRAIRKVLGAGVEVRRGWNGKPQVAGELSVSAAHADDLVFAVAAPQTVACDVEVVQFRPESDWHSLLGRERFLLAAAIAREAAERVDTAATRVWTALESLKKAEVPLETPLALLSSRADGWVCLGAPGFKIATAAHAQGGGAVIFSVLARDAHADL